LTRGLPDPDPGVSALLHYLADVAETSTREVTGFLVADPRREDVLLLAGEKVNAVELINNGFDFGSEIGFLIDREMLIKI